MTELSKDDFETGQAAFDGMVARAMQKGQTAAAATQDAKNLVDTMFPGFAQAYDDYVAEQRASVTNMAKIGILRGSEKNTSWYGGPKENAAVWPMYKAGLRLPQTAIDAIDESTTRILANCANPFQPGDKRKGLVVGYVQSGKTANYAGLIAKAVDAGYRMIIVLAGMHTNLRQQTQARLERDLALNLVAEASAAANIGITWSALTGPESDIGPNIPMGVFNNPSTVAVMVIKKNPTRLAHAAKFLNNFSEEIRAHRGVLIIDDESDQASPNTKGEKQLVSAINDRIRDIWKATKTGTYVAYTATPFANIFIDPSDQNDLYPEDFAIALPRPEGYMGTDTFFDLTQSDDVDDSVASGFVRTVDEEDAKVLAWSGRNIEDFQPHVTESLDSAIRWFVLATAIRQLRDGAPAHSSMLLHTSARVLAHQRLKDAVESYRQKLIFRLSEEEREFNETYEREVRSIRNVPEDLPIPSWHDTWKIVNETIPRLKVVIDNGASTDRLRYPDDDPQFVIAIGGGTLSRGLTLEGLVVSYFLRTSNAYDTLLQMGRWFGFRPGYNDLARVWAPAGLIDDYAHLARVENDLRKEIDQLAAEGRTPSEFAIRVRSHPGRLIITSRDKMWAADVAHVRLSGTRNQTTLLDRSATGIARAQQAVRALVAAASCADGVREFAKSPDGTRLFAGVPNPPVLQFLREYSSPAQGPWVQGDAAEKWIREHQPDTTWNVVLVGGAGNSTRRLTIDEHRVVRAVKRAPLGGWRPSATQVEGFPEGADIVNIRALMSSADWLLDLDVLAEHGAVGDEVTQGLSALQGKRDKEESVRPFRSAVAPSTGVLLIYAIARDSRPEAKSTLRVAMDAPDELIGVGMIYPTSMRPDDHTYYAVSLDTPTIDAYDDAEEFEGLVDDEQDTEVLDAS